MVDYSKTLYEVYRDVMMFHSSRAHTKQYMLSPRRDLDVVRFSQMFQRSLQNLAGNNNTLPYVQFTGLEPTQNHVQTQLVMATGVFAGKIVKVEHPVVEPAPTPLTGLASDTTGASIPAVDISAFDISNSAAESSHYSGNNHVSIFVVYRVSNMNNITAIVL